MPTTPNIADLMPKTGGKKTDDRKRQRAIAVAALKRYVPRLQQYSEADVDRIVREVVLGGDQEMQQRFTQDLRQHVPKYKGPMFDPIKDLSGLWRDVEVTESDILNTFGNEGDQERAFNTVVGMGGMMPVATEIARGLNGEPARRAPVQAPQQRTAQPVQPQQKPPVIQPTSQMNPTSTSGMGPTQQSPIQQAQRDTARFLRGAAEVEDARSVTPQQPTRFSPVGSFGRQLNNAIAGKQREEQQRLTEQQRRQEFLSAQERIRQQQQAQQMQMLQMESEDAEVGVNDLFRMTPEQLQQRKSEVSARRAAERQQQLAEVKGVAKTKMLEAEEQIKQLQQGMKKGGYAWTGTTPENTQSQLNMQDRIERQKQIDQLGQVQRILKNVLETSEQGDSIADDVLRSFRSQINAEWMPLAGSLMQLDSAERLYKVSDSYRRLEEQARQQLWMQKSPTSPQEQMAIQTQASQAALAQMSPADRQLLEAVGMQATAAGLAPKGVNIVRTAADIVVQMLPYMAELSITGPAVSGVRGAGGRVATQMFGDAAKRTAMQRIATGAMKLGSNAAAAVAQAAMNPAAIAADVYTRMTDKRTAEFTPDMKRIEKLVLQEKGDSFSKALAKSVAVRSLEMLSEYSGPIFEAGQAAAGAAVKNYAQRFTNYMIRRLGPRWGEKLKPVLLSRWFAKQSMDAGDNVMSKLSQRVGWNSVFPETMEELWVIAPQNLVEGRPIEEGYSPEMIAATMLGIMGFGSVAKAATGPVRSLARWGADAGAQAAPDAPAAPEPVEMSGVAMPERTETYSGQATPIIGQRQQVGRVLTDEHPAYRAVLDAFGRPTNADPERIVLPDGRTIASPRDMEAIAPLTVSEQEAALAERGLTHPMRVGDKPPAQPVELVTPQTPSNPRQRDTRVILEPEKRPAEGSPQLVTGMQQPREAAERMYDAQGRPLATQQEMQAIAPLTVSEQDQVLAEWGVVRPPTTVNSGVQSYAGTVPGAGTPMSPGEQARMAKEVEALGRRVRVIDRIIARPGEVTASQKRALENVGVKVTGKTDAEVRRQIQDQRERDAERLNWATSLLIRQPQEAADATRANTPEAAEPQASAGAGDQAASDPSAGAAVQPAAGGEAPTQGSVRATGAEDRAPVEPQPAARRAEPRVRDAAKATPADIETDYMVRHSTTEGARMRARKAVRPLAKRLDRGWSPTVVTAENKAEADWMVERGYAQVAYDKQGTPHYARTGQPLPAWLAPSRDQVSQSMPDSPYMRVGGDGRVTLQVPASERSKAQRAGAKWDTKRKVFYHDGPVPPALYPYVPERELRRPAATQAEPVDATPANSAEVTTAAPTARIESRAERPRTAEELDAAIAAQLEEEQGDELYFRTYHGSAARDIEEFRKDKGGTGTGAQNMTPGHYSAEDKQSAEYFRQQATKSRPDDVYINGKRLERDQYRSDADYNAAVEVAREAAVRTRVQVEADLERELKKSRTPGARAEVETKLKALRGLPEGQITRQKPVGQTYVEDIRRERDEFLDWNETVEDQPERVRAALGDLAEEYGSFRPEYMIRDLARTRMQERGEKGAEALARAEQEVTEELYDRGIAGVAYNDTGKVGKRKARNYVTWRPEQDVAIEGVLHEPGARYGARDNEGATFGRTPGRYEKPRRVGREMVPETDPAVERYGWTQAEIDADPQYFTPERLRQIEQDRAIERDMVSRDEDFRGRYNAVVDAVGGDYTKVGDQWVRVTNQVGPDRRGRQANVTFIVRHPDTPPSKTQGEGEGVYDLTDMTADEAVRFVEEALGLEPSDGTDVREPGAPYSPAEIERGNREGLAEVQKTKKKRYALPKENRDVRGLLDPLHPENFEALGEKGTISSVIKDKINGRLDSATLIGKRIDSAQDFAAILLPLRSPYQESLKVAWLDANNRIVDIRIVSVGTIDSSVADPRTILGQRPRGAKKLLISHNHPSGITEPSRADMAVTRRVGETVKAYGGIELVDHVITDGQTYYSFRHGQSFDLAPEYQTPAAWEAARRTDLAEISNPAAFGQVVSALRQSAAAHGGMHVIYVTNSNGITAVQRLPVTIDQKQLTRQIIRTALEEGAANVMIDAPQIKHPAAYLDLIKQLNSAGILVLDMATETVSSTAAIGTLPDPNYPFSPGTRESAAREVLAAIAEARQDPLMLREREAVYDAMENEARKELARASMDADAGIGVPVDARPALDASYEAENQTGVIVGARPGRFDYKPGSRALPPPIIEPPSELYNVEKLGNRLLQILSDPALTSWAEKEFGIRDLQAVQVSGSWLGVPEPSFVLRAENMPLDGASKLADILGLALGQEAVFVTQPYHSEDLNAYAIPTLLVGGGDALTPEVFERVKQSCLDAGIDYSTTVDKKAFKFLIFADGDADLKRQYDAIVAIANEHGLDHGLYNTRSDYHGAENYTGNAGGAGTPSWHEDSTGGPSDLFRGAVDHLLAPYARAAGSAGYRFRADLLAKRFGLSGEHEQVIRERLRPTGSAEARGITSLIRAEEDLDFPTPQQGTRRTVSEIMHAMQMRMAEQGVIDPKDRSPEVREMLARAMAFDVAHHITVSETKKGRKASALGWYDRMWKKAKREYRAFLPGMKNPDNELLFELFMGITSQNSAVPVNSLNAVRLYQLVVVEKRSIGDAISVLGKTMGGATGPSITGNLRKLAQLLDRFTIGELGELFDQTRTVKEWNTLFKADERFWITPTADEAEADGEDAAPKKKSKKKRKPKSTEPKPLEVKGVVTRPLTGWFIFGPKIGSFVNNMRGDYGTLTADLWFQRYWNGLLGQAFDYTPEGDADRRDKFVAALRAELESGEIESGEQMEGVTLEKLDEPGNETWLVGLADEIEKDFRGSGFKNRTDVRYAAKAWTEFRRDAEDAPRNATENLLQQQVANRAQEILREQGYDIEIADMQAALWYAEKELFERYGAVDKESRATDYSKVVKDVKATYEEGNLFMAKGGTYAVGERGSYLPGGPDALYDRRLPNDVDREFDTQEKRQIITALRMAGGVTNLPRLARDLGISMDADSPLLQALEELVEEGRVRKVPGGATYYVLRGSGELRSVGGNDSPWRAKYEKDIADKAVLNHVLANTPKEFRERVEQATMAQRGVYLPTPDVIRINAGLTEAEQADTQVHELAHRMWVRYAPPELHAGLLNAVGRMDAIIGKRDADAIRKAYPTEEQGYEMERVIFEQVAAAKARAYARAQSFARKLLGFFPERFQSWTARKLADLMYGAHTMATNIKASLGNEGARYRREVMGFLAGNTWQSHDPSRTNPIRRMSPTLRDQLIDRGMLLWQNGETTLDAFQKHFAKYNNAQVAASVPAVYKAVKRAMDPATPKIKIPESKVRDLEALGYELADIARFSEDTADIIILSGLQKPAPLVELLREDQTPLPQPKKINVTLPASTNPDVDAAMKAAYGIGHEGIIARLGRGLRTAKNVATRHYQHLDPRRFAAEADALRRGESNNEKASADALRRMQRYYAHVRGSREAFDLMTRWIIRTDLLGDIENGLYTIPARVAENGMKVHVNGVDEVAVITGVSKDKAVVEFVSKMGGPQQYDLADLSTLEGGAIVATENQLGLVPHRSKAYPLPYKSAQELRADIDRDYAEIQKHPEILEAIAARDRTIRSIAAELVALGELPSDVLANPYGYYRHQVLDYYRIADGEKMSGSGKPRSAKDAARKEGWQKSRTGSARAYNTNALEADYEVLKSQLAKIAAIRTLQEIEKSPHNIIEQIRAAKKDFGDADIPDGYVLWKAKPGTIWFERKGVAEEITNTIMAELQSGEDLADKDVQKIVASVLAHATRFAPARFEMVIPKELAATLDGDTFLAKARDNGPIARMAKGLMTKWKQYILLNPLRFLKYNLNNMSGDFDIVMTQPGVLTHVPEALAELVSDARAKGTSSDISEARRYSVIDAGQTISEVQDVNAQAVLNELTGKTDLNIVRRWFSSAREASSFRESIFRLAAYKHYKRQIALGKPAYGASKKVEIDQITDPNIRAAKLSRELLGDYGNLSEMGSYLRTRLIPFWSWMEINAPRYVRVLKNEFHEAGAAAAGKTGAKVAGVVAAKGAVGLVKKSVLAAILMALIETWNRTMFPEEEAQLTERERRQLHVVLGTTGDGAVRTLRLQGAFSDALSWFGMEDLGWQIEDLASGEKSVGDVVRDALEAPVSKMANAVRPDIKVAAEVVAGRTAFPDVFRTTPIRDRVEHMLRSVSLDLPYRYMQRIPMRSTSLSDATILYHTNPGEAAYTDAKTLVREFLIAGGKEMPSGDPTERANALYYYRTALRYGDERAEKKWLNRYFELGGTDKGMATSIRNAHPLHGITEATAQEFWSTLSEKDQRKVIQAVGWYRTIYRPDEVRVPEEVE